MTEKGRLSALPKELLQMVLDVPSKFALRKTCKAFSGALADCCGSISLKRSQLLSRGPRQEVQDALDAFPNARRVVMNLKGESGRWAALIDDDSLLQNLLAESLDAMRGHKVSSLALLHLPCQALAPSTLAAHRATLEELELSDDLYSAALEQGAVNVLARSSDIVARGDSMIELALSMPRLRRLSLASAAFSAQRLVALGSLTQLESLSIVGSVVCPGGAAQAAATHRSLLAALPALRQLRLPMALASCGSALADDEEQQHGNEDEEVGREGGTGHDGSDTDNNSNNNNGTGGRRAPSQLLLSSRRLLFGLGAQAPSARSHGPPAGDGGLAGEHAASGTSAVTASLAHCEVGDAGGRGGVRHRKQLQVLSDVASGFVFPPQLQDLTIPLCALNRPVFEAVCAAAACSAEEASYLPADRLGGPGGSRGAPPAGSNKLANRRAHSYPQLPRGAGAPSAGAMAAGGVLAVWGSEPAGVPAPRPDTPAAPVQPGGGGAWLRSLHIPTLAGYSHWEGSFLASARDFEKLAGLRDLEVLHLSLELSALRMTRDNMRVCFQHLRTMGKLKELRISEAQQPVCFSVRKRSYSVRGPDAFRPSMPSPSLDAQALEQLRWQWPRLQSLQFFAETVVRKDGSLVVADSLDCAELLPPLCACCTEPHLLAAPPRSGGRWGVRFSAARASDATIAM